MSYIGVVFTGPNLSFILGKKVTHAALMMRGDVQLQEFAADGLYQSLYLFILDRAGLVVQSGGLAEKQQVRLSKHQLYNIVCP